MKDTELLLKLNSELDAADTVLKESKASKKQSLANIRAAKGVRNDALIAKCEAKLKELEGNPEKCKEEIAYYRENLKKVRASADKNPDKVGYAKQEITDAKLRLKTARKEIREARKALTYAKHVGDSDKIVIEQETINNIKLNVIRENLICDRVICDAKAYIKKQKRVIKENESLVKTKDEGAIALTKESKEEITKAKEVISKAKKVLPPCHSFKKYYSEHNQAFEAVLLLAPTMILLTLFMIFPLINTGLMSFLEGFRFVNNGGLFAFGHSFTKIGFGEYLKVLKDPVFLRALQNTAIMVVVSVPLTVIIALFISVALNGIKKLQGMYQTIFFLPYVTNSIALGMVFKVMFGTKSGLINAIFGSNIHWLTDPSPAGYWTSLVVLTVYTVWNGLAFKILIFLSGLQSIDKQYYDAALIDGASKGRIFRKITVPLLSPMILYTTITSFIGAFKAYSSVIAVFGRGPNIYGPAGNDKMWITVVGYIYDQMPKMMAKGALSRASAGAVILLIIILLITVVQFIVSKKKVHY